MRCNSCQPWNLIVFFPVPAKNAPGVKKHVGIRRLPSDSSNNNTERSPVPTRKSHSCVSHSHGAPAKTRSRPNSASRIPDTSVDDIENHPLQEAVHFKPLPTRIEPPEDAAILLEEGEVIELEMNGMISSPFRGISLKDFEQQRKLVEEQNRHKVQILQKAIEQQ